MHIEFGNTIVDISNVSVIRSDGRYITFILPNGEEFSFFLGEGKADEVYEKIKSGLVDFITTNKKKVGGRPKKKKPDD